MYKSRGRITETATLVKIKCHQRCKILVLFISKQISSSPSPNSIHAARKLPENEECRPALATPLRATRKRRPSPNRGKLVTPVPLAIVALLALIGKLAESELLLEFSSKRAVVGD